MLLPVVVVIAIIGVVPLLRKNSVAAVLHCGLVVEVLRVIAFLLEEPLSLVMLLILRHHCHQLLQVLGRLHDLEKFQEIRLLALLAVHASITITIVTNSYIAATLLLSLGLLKQLQH